MILIYKAMKCNVSSNHVLKGNTAGVGSKNTTSAQAKHCADMHNPSCTITITPKQRLITHPATRGTPMSLRSLYITEFHRESKKSVRHTNIRKMK
jgi:hypothetical protein